MNWSYRKLGDICISELGKTLDSKRNTGSPMPYLCAANVLWGEYNLTNVKTMLFEPSEVERFSVQHGDMLICEGGDVGRCAIWEDEKPIMYQNALHRVRFTTPSDPWFYLYYFLHLKRSGIIDTRFAKGVTIKHLVKRSLMSIPVPVPSLTEQHRIALELGKIREIQKKEEEQLRLLDKLETSIFYDSFGNPVTNPKGWQSISLSDITTLITDGSHYSPKDEEMGTIPMLSVKNMGARGFDYTDCKMISQEEFKKLEAAGCKPMPDDVLVAKDGSYFKKIFVHQSEAPQAILSSIAIVRPDQTKVTPEFLCSLLSTPDIYNLVEERYLTGTAIKRVILKGLRQLKIIVPPMEMQKQFSKKIWRINAQRRLIEESVVEAQKLFDSRMNYYFGD